MPFGETHLAAWVFACARLAGWTLLDPLVVCLPVTLRLLLAAVLAAVLAPGIATVPVDPLTVPGLFLIAVEMLRGAALALCVWIVFAAIQAAWVWSGHAATGGMLTLTPEQAGPADAAWRTLAGWLAAMAFLAAGGHLLVVDALRDSFTTLPVASGVALPSVRRLVDAGSWLFAHGLQLALPLLALLVLAHLAWSVVARTTPGLNILSAGLGVGMLGLLAVWISAVPLVAPRVRQGIEALGAWLRVVVPG